MAGTLAEMSRMALAHDFRHIDPRSARILLYEAAPRVLPTYPESLSLKAQRHLESLGVEVFTNARVTNVDSDGIVVGGQKIPAATVLWGAGVVASPVGRWLGAETDKSGKVMVAPDLSVRDHPEVFVIGDTAHLSCSSSKLTWHQIANANADARSRSTGNTGRQVRCGRDSSSCGGARTTEAFSGIGTRAIWRSSAERTPWPTYASVALRVSLLGYSGQAFIFTF